MKAERTATNCNNDIADTVSTHLNWMKTEDLGQIIKEFEQLRISESTVREPTVPKEMIVDAETILSKLLVQQHYVEAYICETKGVCVGLAVHNFRF